MENNIVTVRDISTVTAEINVIKQQVRQVALSGAIEIGRRLVEAKGMLPHGEWGSWLERDAQISARQAQRFMQLFDEYGSMQTSLFGGTNTTALSDLPYTKALKLLVIPEDERETFAEENDVANLSNAEIDKLIKERDEAKKQAEEQTEAGKKSRAELDELLKDMASAERDIKSAKEAEAKAAEKAEKAEKAAKAAKDKLAAKEQELAELRAHPQIPEDAMAEIRAEAEKMAAEKEKAERAKETEKLKEEAERARAEAEKQAKAAKEAAEKLEATQKAMKLTNPDVAVFSAMFTQLQETVNRLHGAWIKVAASDPETAGKLSAAKKAYFDKMTKEEW